MDGDPVCPICGVMVKSSVVPPHSEYYARHMLRRLTAHLWYVHSAGRLWKSLPEFEEWALLPLAERDEFIRREYVVAQMTGDA